MAREFQTVGAVQRKARSAKRVLVVGLYSSGRAEMTSRSPKSDVATEVWRGGRTADFVCQNCQKLLNSKTFLTLSTWIQHVSSMDLLVLFQISFRYKPFVTHCTQIWSWLVIMWMLSDIITISFNLYLKCHSCIYTTNQALSHNNETWYMH